MFIKNHSATVAFGIAMAHGFDKKDQALRYFDQMLLTLPSYHIDLADILQQRAILYQEKGEQKLALSDYERALEIRRQRVRENLLGIASLNSNIGNLQRVTSNFEASLNSHHAALSTYEQLYGTDEDHVIKAKVNKNIGLTYYSSGNTLKALEYLTLAQVVYKRLLPEKHLFQIELLGHIGTIHEATGNLTSAEKFFRRQLNWGETILPLDHPLLITFLDSILRIHMKMTQTSNISAIFTKHLQNLNKTLGPQHPTIPRLLFMVAFLLESAQPIEAIKFYEQVIHMSQDLTQPDRLTILKCHKNLASLYRKTGNLTEALKYATRTLDLQQQFLFEEENYSLEAADALHNIGLIYLEMNLSTDALPYLTKSLTMYRSTYSPNHPSVQAVLTSIIHAANQSQSIS
ncbi:unnamed protein product [Rotaria sp. Silwood1]|nr:unnamed protein product [Rotaria sp. Silwood1]CAF1630863.1 unnamed protein product [Rotaria sp. Silwood1]CAF3845740.1 unnamed protein product [Rotaria sp. Silwood1]CAF3940450.1 unnamed protein product [Rotaria sp. Silwood1]CAF4681937.1 unnamed protein product [Rotaria sp. Silwood1]